MEALMITFALVTLTLGFGIWFWVRKSDKPASDDCAHHSSADCVDKHQKNEQPHVKATPVATLQVGDTIGTVHLPQPAAANNVADGRPPEGWLNWLALSTTIIAILAAFMSIEVSRGSTMAVLSSGDETNIWGQYQSKSVKEHTFQISKAGLELQLAAIQGMSPETADKYRNTIKKYDEELKRYKDEKDEIQEKAKSTGKKKEKFHKLSAGLTNSLLFLQVAIVLSSIAMITRKKYIWYIGLSSLVGWLYFLIMSF